MCRGWSSDFTCSTGYDPSNRPIAVALDEYYRIGAGLAFAPPDAASLAHAGYRLHRSDLERMTTIVPEIGDVRAGDLIVRYDTAGSPHIGIVVGTRWETPGKTSR